MKIDNSLSALCASLQIESIPRGTRVALAHARDRGFLVPNIFAFYTNRIQYHSIESGMQALQYIAGHISTMYANLFTKEGQH